MRRATITYSLLFTFLCLSFAPLVLLLNDAVQHTFASEWHHEHVHKHHGHDHVAYETKNMLDDIEHESTKALSFLYQLVFSPAEPVILPRFYSKRVTHQFRYNRHFEASFLAEIDHPPSPFFSH